MQIPYPLLQTIVVPVIVAGIIALIHSRLGRKTGWVTGACLVYTTALLCLIGPQIYSGNPIYEEYTWVPIAKLKFGLLADGLSWPVALIMNITCAALAFYSINYIDHRIHLLYGREAGSAYYGLYNSFFLLFATGFAGVAFATNLIMIFLFIELLLIPLFFIMSYFGYIDRHRVAMMCFLWGVAGGLLFLTGIMIAYAQIGSFRLSDLPHLVGKPLAFWACFFMLIGTLVKMAVFGFHVWMPWVHAEHPTCIAGILADYANIGTYVIVRVLIQPLYRYFQLFSVPLMAWALITMVYGALLTLAQDDVKRLCACSTISQISYSLLGIASCTRLGIAGGVFYFLSHCLGKSILFSTAGLLVYETGKRDIRRMGGLAAKMPITAILWAMGSMILSAIPLLSGFQAEWIMFAGIFRSGVEVTIKLPIAILGILATALTAAYTFWPMRRIFFGPLPDDAGDIKDPPLAMTIPLLLLGVISLLLGIYPKMIMDLFTPYVEGLPIG